MILGPPAPPSASTGGPIGDTAAEESERRLVTIEGLQAERGRFRGATKFAGVGGWLNGGWG